MKSLVILGLLAIAVLIADVQSMERLSGTTYPLSYFVKLTLPTRLSAIEFSGGVTVTIRARENTNRIVLYSNLLTINSVSVQNSDGGLIGVDSFHLDDVEEKLVIETVKNLEANSDYVVSIEYTGNLEVWSRGLYRSAYMNNGLPVPFEATFIRSTEGRSIFPCYDEPSYKAVFTLQIVHDRKNTARSNLELVSTERIDESNSLSTFGSNVLQSVHTLAFVISDFTEIRDPSGRFRLILAPDIIDDGEFALELNKKLTIEVQHYFNVELSTQCLQQIGVPNYSTRALEGWGLAIYNPMALALTPKSTIEDRDYIVRASANTYTKYLFGNLITPEWWSEIWMREGITTYYEYFIADRLFPESRMRGMFVVEMLQRGLFSDSDIRTSPISRDVDNPYDIDGIIMNSLTATKGAAIFRLIESLYSEDVFRRALQRLLREKALSTYVSDDLYAAIQHEIDAEYGVGTPVPLIFVSWTKQAGYPLLTVTRDYATNTAVIEQSRFIAGIQDQNIANDQVWWIPITYITSQQPDRVTASHWFNTKKEIISLPTTLEPSDWVLFNAQQTGFYRVNYDLHTWNLLIDQLHSDNYTDISAVNRAQLLDDSLQLAHNFVIDFELTLRLWDYLERETDIIPWFAARRSIMVILSMLTASPDALDLFKMRVQRVVDPVFHKLGMVENEFENDATLKLRDIIVDIACAVHHASCIKDGELEFTLAVNDRKDILPRSRPLIYCNGMRHASVETIISFLEKLHNPLLPSDHRRDIIAALSCVQDLQTSERLIRIISDTKNNLFVDADRTVFIQAMSVSHNFTHISQLINHFITTPDSSSYVN